MMIDAIKRGLRKIAYAFAFAIKGGDDAIGTQDQNETVVGVVQQQQAQSLGEALLKGEVTKQVEELRYMDYKVSKESKRFHHIGNGVTIETRKPQKNLKRFKFKQGNPMVCEDVYHELQRIDDYAAPSRYLFELTYIDVPTVKLEPYISYGEFDIDDNHIKVSFVFDKNIRSNEDPITKILLRRLGEISRYNSGYQIEHDDICSNVAMLTFTTSNATNEDDYVRYDILGMSFDSCKEVQDGFILTYSSSNFKRFDLTEQFYSKELEEKYRKKAPKGQNVELYTTERKFYCDDCGKEMNEYDASITKYTFGRQLCQDCIKTNMLY